MTKPIQRLLPLLDDVRPVSGGQQWMARCPAHNDRSPSLSLREGENGIVLINCFGGCSAEAVMAALGLQLRDLYPDKPFQGHGKKRPKRPDLNPWKVLEALEHLIVQVYLAASQLGRGEPLNTAEQAELRSISERILAILRGVRNAR